MSYSVQKIGAININQNSSVGQNVYVKQGYTLLSIPTQENNNKSDPNVSVGGVYQKGNISRSMHNLSNTGTLMGQLPIVTPDELLFSLQQNNYLTSLIPGIYPYSSGMWSQDQKYYDLNTILDKVQSDENEYFCKILGFGLGEIDSYKVSKVSKSGVTSLAFNLKQFSQSSTLNTISIPFNQIRLTNYSSQLDGFVYPYTTVGQGFYTEGFDWQNYYGLQVWNGTNTFPFFGWAGSRIGGITPQNFQFQQNSQYSYPSSYLVQAKSYNPIGLIYAGQGVQLCNYPNITTLRTTTFNERNTRIYQEYISNSKLRGITQTGIAPYQQGKGSYDFFSKDVTYDEQTGEVIHVEMTGLIGSEGAQPGRNNAFIGVALTDYWSKNLNINNVEASSLTPQDTRMTYNNANIIKQTKTAHNSPLAYIEENDSNNTDNPLPWSSLFGYIGDTTTSPSNERSANTPIITEGLTTMVVSGAYPLYRGAWETLWYGVQTQIVYGIGMIPLDQYYFTVGFWNPEYDEQSITQIEILDEPSSVPPNPPYRIKGGKIVLFEGQRVKAGSYVYSTINMIGNVGMSQFYPPAGKDIVLNQGEKDQLMGDLYSKFQFNQGGLIVMVSIDGREQPPPPSCAVPVGIVMEDIVGYGQPNYNSNDIQQNILYRSRYGITNPNSKYYDFNQMSCTQEEVNHLQSREIIIKLFPMYSNLNLTAAPVSFYSLSILGIVNIIFPISYVACQGNLIFSNWLSPTTSSSGITPLVQRIKSNYMVQADDSSLNGLIYQSFTGGWSLAAKESRNDYPYMP